MNIQQFNELNENPIYDISYKQLVKDAINILKKDEDFKSSIINLNQFELMLLNGKQLEEKVKHLNMVKRLKNRLFQITYENKAHFKFNEIDILYYMILHNVSNYFLEINEILPVQFVKIWR